MRSGVGRLFGRTAMNGAVEQKNWPNTQSLRNAEIGVMVADMQQTRMSEQDSEKMNMLGTVWRGGEDNDPLINN